MNLEDLPDKSAQNANLKDGDASDKFRTLDENGEWLVMMGVCTHLGCVPLGDAGDFGDGFAPVMDLITTQLVELEEDRLPQIYPFLLHRCPMTEY